MKIKTQSEELLNTGRKLSAVLEDLPVGVLISDVMGRICQTNDQVSRIWKSLEPIESDSYGKLFGWWDNEGHMIKEKHGPLFRAIRGEDSHNEIMNIICFDGTTKSILGSASPLRGQDGHIVGAVVLIQDVTEPKKIQKDLEQRITKLISIGVQLEQTS